MFAWLFGLSDRMNRSTDMAILWPACRKHVPTALCPRIGAGSARLATA